jgi:hypothetical protein
MSIHEDAHIGWSQGYVPDSWHDPSDFGGPVVSPERMKEVLAKMPEWPRCHWCGSNGFVRPIRRPWTDALAFVECENEAACEERVLVGERI